MINVFNTPFEISLRVLLILASDEKHWKTVDMIAAADFITVYGSDFGISANNLHGENCYKFSEFAIRRKLVKKAIKMLVLNGLINVSTLYNGFSYSINQKGNAYCAKFENEYATTYRILAKQALVYIASKSERDILKIINRHSVSSLQRGDING